MTCDLDPINMCCWTHGVDIDEADYGEGCCYMGEREEELDDDEPEWDPDEREL